MSDRGMLKWTAFNALLEHGTTVGKMIQNRHKLSQPILSEDALEEMNETLLIAIEEHRKVCVSYFKNGAILKEEGFVKKVDVYQKNIVISDQKLSFHRITKIELI